MVARERSELAGAVETPRRLLGIISSLLWAVGAVVVGWFLWPTSLGGCTTLTIVSGQSMEPTYYTGDLVVSRCGPVEVGDVVVYNPPDVEGARIIHRIVGGDAAEGWIIQGDNNDFLDPWRPTEENILGSSVLHLPHVGKVAAILLSPLTWISILTVALAVIVWPGRGTDDEEPAEDAEPEGPDQAEDPEKPESPEKPENPEDEVLAASTSTSTSTSTD